ncbi:hypothetical protein Tco_0593154 [Tanacetum coccineum]
MAEKEDDMVEKDVSTSDPVTIAGEVVTNTKTTVDELTLARTLIEIKAAKPKAVTTVVTRPKARGIRLCLIRRLLKKLLSALAAEVRMKRETASQKEEDAYIVEWLLFKLCVADYELAARLQVEEQGELTIEEKSRLFVELMNKRKKHFARLRAEEQRRKPPTKAQKINTIETRTMEVLREGEELKSENLKKQKLDENCRT